MSFVNNNYLFKLIIITPLHHFTKKKKCYDRSHFYFVIPKKATCMRLLLDTHTHTYTHSRKMASVTFEKYAVLQVAYSFVRYICIVYTLKFEMHLQVYKQMCMQNVNMFPIHCIHVIIIYYHYYYIFSNCYYISYTV